MEIVLITALGVGFATIFGGIIGFIFKKASTKFNDIILSFASGVMLFSAITGLILPSLEFGGAFSILFATLGILSGALVMDLCDKFVPHISSFFKKDKEKKITKSEHKAILFVLAIAVHNLPEGIATGVAFGTEDTSLAFMVALGIALQNIPEGMIVIPPLLKNGYTKKRALGIAFFTGVIEILGVIIGYFLISVSSTILPFALAMAGGAMIYVISDEMIPETHSHGNEREASYALVFGCCLMLIFDYFL